MWCSGQATGWKIYVSSREKDETFLPSKTSREALGPIQPPIAWLPAES